LRKPPLSSASRPSRAGVALMSISWATVSGRMNSPGGELAGDDELPHVRGRLVAEPRPTLAPGRLAHGCRFCRVHRSSPPRLTSCLAITPRWISLVPSPTIISGASRK